MLRIICGEDSVSSFNFFISLKKSYEEKEFKIIDINSSDLENITSWMGETNSLFSEKKIFCTQNISKLLSKKINLKINKIIENLISRKDIEVIDWEEEISSRFLKFPKGAVIKEFKLPLNIFKLQDALYPGNLKNFLEILNTLNESIDENFIFIMLIRHLKNLLLTKTKEIENKLPQWQIYKLKSQAAKWDIEKLINFYDSFHKLDISQKTSSSPYSLKESLEILSVYYL